MKQRMKRAVAFICASVMTISSCLVDGTFLSKASEPTTSQEESAPVIKFNNPGIGVNVGEQIDLSKYDVQFTDGVTTNADKLTWYQSKKIYQIPYQSPAIPVTVGETIILNDYEVQFTDGGDYSPVTTWKDGDNVIVDITPDKAGVYQLTASAPGMEDKFIYVVAKEETDQEYVLFQREFESSGATSETDTYIYSNGDFVNKPNEAHYMTKLRQGPSNSYYNFVDQTLKMYRESLNQTNMHLLLPNWLSSFGNYDIEMDAKRVEYSGKNNSFLGIDFRSSYQYDVPSAATNDSNLTDSSPEKAAYLTNNYFLRMGVNNQILVSYCEDGKMSLDSPTYSEVVTKQTVQNFNSIDFFTMSLQVKDNTVAYQISQNDALVFSKNPTVIQHENYPSTGRIGIYVCRLEGYIDSIKVALVNDVLEYREVSEYQITHFTAREKGLTSLVVKDDQGSSKTVYIVVKNVEDTEYVLWENNFDSAEDAPYYDMGTTNDYDGFGRLYGSNQYSVDTTTGRLETTGSSVGHYRFPKWIGDFGNYRIQLTEKTKEVSSASKQIGLYARGGDTKNYTPNYTVLVKYQGYASDGIALKTQKEWVDDNTKNAYNADIVWGKVLNREKTDLPEKVNPDNEYIHELLVQDDLIEYKINGKTRLYDIRERETKTGYVGFKLDSGIKISIDSVRVLFVPDIEAPDAPISAVYNRTTNVAGMADGKVTVKIADTGSTARDVLCYWGNGTDVLSEYTHFGKTEIKTENQTQTGEIEVDLGKNIMIPEGATEIRVYTENSAGQSKGCAIAALPAGTTSLTMGQEVMSFQVISDTHITTKETGYASINFKKFLEKVSINDDNSSGIFIGGDLVDKGKATEYETFQKIWDSVEAETGKKLPDMHAIIGNHEFWTEPTYEETMQVFNEFTGNKKNYFSEEINGYHFIYLATAELAASTNTSHTNAILGEAQLQWLDATLNKKTEENKPIFIFLHQPLQETVAGSSTSGVQEHEELKAILKKYPQAVFFTSHSHMNLDTPQTLLTSQDNGICNMFNTSAISYLMNTHYTDKTITSDGAQAYYVEVYQDKLLVRGKDVITDKWLPSSQFVIFLEGYPAPEPNSDVYMDFTGYTDSNDLKEDLKNDFKAYTLADISQTAEEVDIDTAFVATDKGMKRNSSKQGSDYKGFSILTYTGEQYENFELELEYRRDNLRYGVMFGGELGEFAYSSTSSDEATWRGTYGMAFTYVENEGRRAARGAFSSKETYAPSYRSKNNPKLEDYSNTRTHKLTIRVVGDCMAMYVDGDTTNAITLKMDGYTGGYISLVANGTLDGYGAFRTLKISKLDENAQFGFEQPSEKDGFSTLDKIEEDFDAFYMVDASESIVMEPISVARDWWFNAKGFLARYAKGNGNIVDKDINVLTYTKEQSGDFELAFDYQQTYGRLGVILGGEYGKYPLSVDKNTGTYSAEGGIIFYLEKEGNPNAQGDFVNGYTSETEVRRRLSAFDSFNESENGTVHHVKLVVKDKDLYIYVDGSVNPMYLALPDDYTGGYVSLFSGAEKEYGIDNFVISDTITTILPGDNTDENVYEIDFTKLHGAKELNDDFNAYYLSDLEEQTKEVNAEDIITTVGKGVRSNAKKAGSDSKDFRILTLNTREYQNFELELVYGQSYNRYGVMFGGDLGEFAVYDNSVGTKGTQGVAFAYTEAEGYRNVRGALAAGMITATDAALKRLNDKLDSFVNSEGKIDIKASNDKLHTLRIRVVGDWMTMVVDGNEESRLTVRIDGYSGGYISLVTNGSKDNPGVFNYLKITALDDSAELDCEKPQEKSGFTTLESMKNDFDAYYLEDATKSSEMKKVDFFEKWWFNKQGFLARFKSGNGSETKKVDVLTYNKQEFTDFQVEFDYQQTYNRTGIIIGAEKGIFPIGEEDDTRVATGGVMLFLEAESVVNAMGDFTNGYSNKSELRRRLTTLQLEGFTDENGKANSYVDQKAVHHITIVVKDKQLYLFVDGSERCAMYLTLPDTYAGGYVSLFSSAPKEFGFDNLVISETITKAIPAKEQVVTKNGNEVNIDFNVDIPDTTGLSAYYLKKLGKTGELEKRDIYANWMIANGKLNKQSNSVGTNDTEKITVLTYAEETYENFVATFEYQLTRGRLMLLFGTEEGKYPLYNKNGNHENGGVMLYAEADLGSGGGICALGDVKIATEGYRPMYRELSYAPGYYVKKDNGELKAGVKYTMTVAVYNKQCYVYIEGFGLVSAFELNDDYKEGYISLASTSTEQHGFTFLNITRIDDANAIKKVSQIKDITVQTETALESLALPTTVEVTNAADKKVDVPVEWTNKGYNAAEEGNYLFEGTLLMSEGMTNPGKMSAQLTVRVREKLPKTSKATKMWTFDTASDLLDFKSYYIGNAKKDKPVESDYPAWFVRNGKLQKDQNRSSSSGSETAKLNILTYTGAKYKNFELEVDFSQQYAREMILFGSKTPAQYFNYEDVKSTDNPISVFVEFEGRRNAMGNIVNTNFYNRTSSNISNAREDYAENNNYYDKTKKVDKAGTMHHLKLRVVGDTFTVWLDEQKTVFSGKIGEGYEGGYISLVSTAQKGRFDNLKITRLNEQGKPIAENQDVVATGKLDVAYTKLDKPVDPQVIQPSTKQNISIGKIAIIAAPIVALGATLTVVGTVAKKNKIKKKEGNS